MLFTLKVNSVIGGMKAGRRRRRSHFNDFLCYGLIPILVRYIIFAHDIRTITVRNGESIENEHNETDMSNGQNSPDVRYPLQVRVRLVRSINSRRISPSMLDQHKNCLFDFCGQSIPVVDDLLQIVRNF